MVARRSPCPDPVATMMIIWKYPAKEKEKESFAGVRVLTIGNCKSWCPLILPLLRLNVGREGMSSLSTYYT
jgi:hypothetical protein